MNLPRRQFLHLAATAAALPWQRPELISTGNFDFRAAENLDVLGRGVLQYAASASSHFQAEPLVLDSHGDPVITSDWEIEVVKNIQGRFSKISGAQHPSEFPSFIKNKDAYVTRSAEVGETMFRFSLDFARLCPRENEFNSSLMADYVRTLARMRARGLEPMLSLYHWPLPQYLLTLDDRSDVISGGWEHAASSRHFRWYITNVLNFLTNSDKLRKALELEALGKEPPRGNLWAAWLVGCERCDP